jgi:hypothetical protein
MSVRQASCPSDVRWTTYLSAEDDHVKPESHEQSANPQTNHFRQPLIGDERTRAHWRRENTVTSHERGKGHLRCLTPSSCKRNPQLHAALQRTRSVPEQVRGIPTAGPATLPARRYRSFSPVLTDLGDPAVARPLLQRALAIDEAGYGPEHPPWPPA